MDQHGSTEATMAEDAEFLTMKQFAQRHGVSYSWVKQLAREGKLVSAQPTPNGKRLIPADAFTQLIPRDIPRPVAPNVSQTERETPS